MGFVYSECAFVENLLPPPAQSPEPLPSVQIHTQLREIILEQERAGQAGPSGPSHWRMPGCKYKESSWVW